jgi:signal transduction histidine kinase
MLKSSWRTMRGLEGRNTKLAWQAELLNERLREEQREVDELKELNRLREDFISMTSHELRTPLTTILGVAKTLQKPQFAEDPSIRLELLQATERQADHLAVLVENLLTSARINGNTRLQFDTFEFHECVQDALVNLGPKSSQVVLKISSGLPRMTTDRTALKQILVNLLDNALKFAPGRPCELGAEQASPGVLRFRVRDEGVGIPREQLDRIFARFYQVDSSLTRPFGGLGLGLSLVKELVQSLEGTLEVHSSPGHGSEFVITLPLVHSAAHRASVPDVEEGLREAG